MRFLADENVPGATISALAGFGHNVSWIRTRSPGANDLDVLAIAIADERILLTFDKDFGERARGASLPPSCGIILVRAPVRNPVEAVRLASSINARNDWSGNFSVVEPGRVRMRPLQRT
jgi:predicted nuclease of predicted toxin-antitoxin system